MTRINRLAATMAVSILAIIAAMHLDGRRNPTRRPAETWTAGDVRRLFAAPDPELHWCDRHHGHAGERGPIWRCKGRYASVFADLERTQQFDPAVEDVLIELFARPPSDVASRAAETLGTWTVARATPALLRSVRTWHEGRHPERRLVVMCMLWALDRTGAPHELADLESLGSSVSLGDLQVFVDRVLLPGIADCPAPHRK